MNDALQFGHNDDPCTASRPSDRRAVWPKPLGGGKSGAWPCGAAGRAFGTRPPYDPFNPLHDPSAMIAAMQAALDDCGIEPAQLSLISANGSSSAFYDALEAGAIRAVFGEAMPADSMKGVVGKTGAVTPVLQRVGRAWVP